MKKWFLMIGIVAVLSGCSADKIFDKLPFLQKEEEKADPEEKGIENGVNEPPQENQGDKNPGEQNTPGDKDPSHQELVLEDIFFNEIIEVNNRKVIQNPRNIMVLVNKEFGLPDGYVPEDLVRPNVAFSFGDQDIEKSYMRKEAAGALEKMFAEAANNGIQLFAVSGYRSFDRQTDVFNAEVANVGHEQAVQVVAYPGNSEHQTGLSMDISSASVNYALSEQFGQSTEGKWLVDNAHRFGFILRYPSGKEAITGYNMRPGISVMSV